MPHPLDSLTRATTGIIEVWINDLVHDSDVPDSGRLGFGCTLDEVGALSLEQQAQYVVPVEHLTGYVVGLFEAYEAGRYHALDLVYLRNQDDNVVAVFDCRRFLKLAPESVHRSDGTAVDA